MVGPGLHAVQLAQSGHRYPIPASQVKPGTFVWMPWAGVIKITSQARRREQRERGEKRESCVSGDGVEVFGGGKDYVSGNGKGRPRRRAWNHPAVIIKREGEKVWILPLTSFKGHSVTQKFNKFPDRVKEVLLSRILPVDPAPEHPLVLKKRDKRYSTLKLVGSSENGKRKKLPRPGYVKVDTVYKLDWRDLERWPRRNHSGDGNEAECFILDDECLERLLNLLKRKNGAVWKTVMGDDKDKNIVGSDDRVIYEQND